MTRPSDLFVIQRYDDAPAAFEWLARAFGFQKRLEVPNDEDASIVAFAELALGDDVLGSGSTRPGLRHAIAVYVEDVDAHYARAKAAGAQIVDELKDTSFGARIYVALDPDGHLWSFGTHRPDKPTGCSIFPAIRYRDAIAAGEWLERAFGLEKRVEIVNEDGSVAHAEMGLDYGLVMFNSAGDPAQTGNVWDTVDFGIYVALDGVDAHYERAKAAGAGIVREISDTDYGSREYSVRDLEGNLWSFGTYRPEGTKP